MTTIIVGVDDHEGSRDAVCLGAGLAGKLGAELVVAAAIEYSPLPIESSDYDRARREHFDGIFAAVASELGDFPYRRFELEHKAASSLEELAAREHADMLVLGHTHHGRLGRIYPGTLGDKLLEGAPCPVAVAPPDYAKREHTGFGTVGVAYDGGPEAQAALVSAEALASVLECALQVITIAPMHPGVDDPMLSVRESMYRERHAVGLRSVSATEVEGVFDRGEPARVLARHGVDLDLLVIGSRSHGPVLRTVLGSVGSELMRAAPCPLIVVPRSAEKQSDSALAAR
jgi:nucleotide-binding universal stress UspA family protein